jgi:hypothetical protein
MMHHLEQVRRNAVQHAAPSPHAGEGYSAVPQTRSGEGSAPPRPLTRPYLLAVLRCPLPQGESAYFARRAPIKKHKARNPQ